MAQALLATMKQRVSAWARACFTLDLRSLALFRIGLGVVIFIDVTQRMRDARVFYSDDGVLPRSELLRNIGNRPLPSLYLLDGSVNFQLALLALTAACAVAIVVGWRTRIASIACWVLLLSIQNRHIALNTGADSVEIALLLFGCFLPLGAHFSLDARRQSGGPPTEGHVFTWAAAAIVLQLVMIYVFNVIHKNEVAWWRGTAVMMTLHIDQHATPIGVFLREHARWLGAPMTWGTIVAESSALLLLVSWRNSAARVIAFVTLWALHIGFALCLELGMFSTACMAGWLAVLPASAWQRGPLARLARRFAPTPPAGAAPVEGDAAPSSPRAFRLAWPLSLLVAVLIVLELGHNVGHVGGPRLPRVVTTFASPLRVQHMWRMFGSPGVNDGWYVIPGTLRSGRKVDLFHDGAPVTFAKPPSVAATYTTARWRKFMMTASGDSYVTMRKRLAGWLCRSWNETHAGDDELLHVQVIFMLEKTSPKGLPGKPKPKPLLDYDCITP